MSPRFHSAFAVITAMAAVVLAGAGCFPAPEACSDCNNNGSGGALGTAGTIGAGGHIGVGGTFGTGGAPGAGGATDGGGTPGLGGTTGAGGNGVGGMMGVGGTTGAGGRGAGGVAGLGGMTGVGGGIVDVDLVAWWRFDETSGTLAADSSGHGRTAMLATMGTGTATFSSSTRQVGVASLDLASSSAAVGGFATLPASLNTMGGTTAITIACWVNVRTDRGWQRIFDFGSSTGAYMFLTPQQAVLAPNSPRFGITTGGNTVEQVIDMTNRTPLSTGAWHHLAVVLAAGSPYTGTLYVDKVAVGANPAMTLRPSDIGDSVNNWIGRSQFALDDLFDGQIDDFRIYKRALTGAEIAALP